MNRLNEACIYVYGKPVARNRRARRRPGEKKFPFVGTPMVIIDRPTMTNAPLLNMMNKACEYKDPSVENIPININKGERQFVVGRNGIIHVNESSSEDQSPPVYLEPTIVNIDPKRSGSPDSKRLSPNTKSGVLSLADCKRITADLRRGYQSPLDSKRMSPDQKRGAQSPFDYQRMTHDQRRGAQSPFDYQRINSDAKRGFHSPYVSKRMTTDAKRGIQGEDSEQRPPTACDLPVPDNDFVVASAAPRTRGMRLPTRQTPDKQSKRTRRQSPGRTLGTPKLEPYLRRRKATSAAAGSQPQGKIISPAPATHHIDMVNNDADTNVVKNEEYHTANTSDAGTSSRKSSPNLRHEANRRPMHPLVLPNSPHLVKQLAKLDGVTSMKFSLQELNEPPQQLLAPLTPPFMERQCQATPLPSHEVLTNKTQRSQISSNKSFSKDDSVQKDENVTLKKVSTATNQTQYGNGVLPINPVDDVREYLLRNKTIKELQAPKFIQIADAPRVKVIAEKFIRFKKNNVELRKTQEKVVCLEYDIYNEDNYKEPAEVMRAYFSIKMPCPNCEEENSLFTDLALKEIPSHIRNKFHLEKEDITKTAVKQIEVIDETIDNNKTYLEDLKLVLKRQKLMNEKRTKSSLDLLSMYEMAKKECPPFDYEFSSTNLLSKAELNELKALILQKCDSCNGVNRTGMKVSTSLRSDSVMYDLLRSGLQLETKEVVPDLYKCFWNN